MQISRKRLENLRCFDILALADNTYNHLMICIERLQYGLISAFFYYH